MNKKYIKFLLKKLSYKLKIRLITIKRFIFGAITIHDIIKKSTF